MHLYVPTSAREELKALGPDFKKAYNVSNWEQAKQGARRPCCIVANVVNGTM